MCRGWPSHEWVRVEHIVNQWVGKEHQFCCHSLWRPVQAQLRKWYIRRFIDYIFYQKKALAPSLSRFSAEFLVISIFYDQKNDGMLFFWPTGHLLPTTAMVVQLSQDCESLWNMSNVFKLNNSRTKNKLSKLNWSNSCSRISLLLNLRRHTVHYMDR